MAKFSSTDFPLMLYERLFSITIQFSCIIRALYHNKQCLGTKKSFTFYNWNYIFNQPHLSRILNARSLSMMVQHWSSLKALPQQENIPKEKNTFIFYIDKWHIWRTGFHIQVHSWRRWNIHMVSEQYFNTSKLQEQKPTFTFYIETS